MEYNVFGKVYVLWFVKVVVGCVVDSVCFVYLFMDLCVGDMVVVVNVCVCMVFV